jgi:hypothetical protein
MTDLAPIRCWYDASPIPELRGQLKCGASRRKHRSPTRAISVRPYASITYLMFFS